MSEKKSQPWTKEEADELKPVFKLPKGKQRQDAFHEIAARIGRTYAATEFKFYDLIKKKKGKVYKKKRISEKREKEKSVGRKSYETRLRNQQLGIPPKVKKTNKRKFHNPPKEGAMQISRNELRFPFKKISIEGGDVVVSF